MYKVFRIEQVFPSTQIDSSSTFSISFCFSLYFVKENEWYVIIIIQQWKTYLIDEISILQITKKIKARHIKIYELHFQVRVSSVICSIVRFILCAR